MSALGTFSARGFQVTASNAIDLIAGTQAAGAGMVSANVRDVGQLLHVDFANLSRTVASQGSQLASINSRGFDSVTRTLEGGFGTLETLSGLSIATQALGFFAVTTQIAGLRREVRELTGKAAELVELQRTANGHLESLADFAQRQLKTQEQILATLVSSRTVEAQQLVRQGWDNLRNGYEDDAFERFQRSLEYDNTVYVTHAELGAINEKRGQLPKAEDHFRRAARFAGQAGPAIVAFAAVQLASFLDRRGRYAEALSILRDGLQGWRTPAWVFYLAEVAAEAGDSDAALKALREAVDGDVAFFSAAMMSDRLQRVQPKLARTLLDIDAERRAPVLEALRRAAVAAAQIDEVSGERQEHRGRARALFERLVFAPYNELVALREDAERLFATVEDTLDRLIHDAIEPISTMHSDLVKCVDRPPSSKPHSAVNSFLQPGVIALICLGLFWVCVALDWWCASALMLVAMLIAFAVHLQTQPRPNEATGQAAHSTSEEWWDYKDRAEKLREDLQRRRDQLRERLIAATRLGSNRTLSEAVQWIDKLSSPTAHRPPAWVSMR